LGCLSSGTQLRYIYSTGTRLLATQRRLHAARVHDTRSTGRRVNGAHMPVHTAVDTPVGTRRCSSLGSSDTERITLTFFSTNDTACRQQALANTCVSNPAWAKPLLPFIPAPRTATRDEPNRRDLRHRMHIPAHSRVIGRATAPHKCSTNLCAPAKHIRSISRVKNHKRGRL
jgi:hypothetical protein